MFPLGSLIHQSKHLIINQSINAIQFLFWPISDVSFQKAKQSININTDQFQFNLYIFLFLKHLSLSISVNNFVN